MARIYIATSWKNMDRQKLVQELREHGHKVYEFRRYSGEGDMPVLEEISLKYGLGEKYRTKTLEPGEYEKIIFDKKARMCFSLHAPAIEKADICILLLPAGRSAHIEAGLLSGRGTKVIVYDSGQYTKAELAYGYFDGYTSDKEELFRMLEEPIPGVCRVCGCTNDNACYHPDYGCCHWVDESLCSHCAEESQGGYGIGNDEQTEHCVNEEEGLYI